MCLEKDDEDGAVRQNKTKAKESVYGYGKEGLADDWCDRMMQRTGWNRDVRGTVATSNENIRKQLSFINFHVKFQYSVLYVFHYPLSTLDLYI